MGTSVGSGALTLRKAIIFGSIFEFAGNIFDHFSERLKGQLSWVDL